ncbi:unnamed protein product [Psylliodes chrysocephalus]|uniref:Uncharacterized protein n=1 Tax=Psylliodes chrysocephalus TaxID=3402493 RepID=A0A9P0D746_9CUCU|nr:unnamed protein product [Psylliodes chrysocephala]
MCSFSHHREAKILHYLVGYASAFSKPRQNEEDARLNESSYGYKVRVIRNGRAEEVPVCFKAFQSLFGIKDSILHTIKPSQRTTVELPMDGREKHTNRPHKMSQQTRKSLCQSSTSHSVIHEPKRAVGAMSRKSKLLSWIGKLPLKKVMTKRQLKQLMFIQTKRKTIDHSKKYNGSYMSSLIKDHRKNQKRKSNVPDLQEPNQLYHSPIPLPKEKCADLKVLMKFCKEEGPKGYYSQLISAN